MPRSLLVVAISLIVGVVLPGCLETTETYVIGADGSGTVEARYVAHLKPARQMADVIRMMYRPGRKQVTLPEPFGGVWIRRAAKDAQGYRVEGVATDTANDIRTDSVKGRFASFADGAKGGMFIASNTALMKTTWRPDPDSNAKEQAAWRFSMAETWASGGNQIDVVKFAPLFRRQLSNFRIQRRITLPAKVLETNGTLLDDGRTVEWTIEYDQLTTKDAQSLEIVFEASPGLKLESFSHQPDLMPLMKRFSDPAPSARTTRSPSNPIPVEDTAKPAAVGTPRGLAFLVIVKEIEAAHAAGDTTRLKTLSGEETIDPWPVLHWLWARGQNGAAKAYLEGLDEELRKPLTAYHRSLEGVKDDDIDRKMLVKALHAYEARAWTKLIEVTHALPEKLERVPRIWIALLRSNALSGHKQVTGLRLARRSAQSALDLGWPDGALAGYRNAASAAGRLGLADDMLKLASDWHAVAKSHGGASERLAALTSIAEAHALGGMPRDGLDALDQAHALLDEIPDGREKFVRLQELGTLCGRAGESRQGIRHLQDALALARKLDLRFDQRTAMLSIATIYFARSDYRRALTWNQRVLKLVRENGWLHHLGMSHAKIASIYRRQGRYGDALSELDEAMRREWAHGRPTNAERLRNHLSIRWTRVASLLREISAVYADLGDLDRALEHLFLATEGDGGPPRLMMQLHSEIGRLYLQRNAAEKALEHHEVSLFFRKTEQEPGRVEVAYTDIGDVHLHVGDHEKSKASYEAALERLEARSDRMGQTRALRGLGRALIGLGKTEEGLSMLKRSVALARRLKSLPEQLAAQEAIADARLRTGNPEGALAESQIALEHLEKLYTGLGEGEGHRARGQHAGLFATGALAAARVDDLGECFRFLDSARAGLLLESLGNRESLKDARAELPEELLVAEKEAKEQVIAARRSYVAAKRRRDYRVVRESARTLDAALDREEAIVNRIQRELKKLSGRFYESAATLAEVSESLQPGQNLVIYGICHDEAIAIVVTPDDQRLVELGPSAKVLEGSDALLEAIVEADTGLPAEQVKRARALLLDPLKLSEDVTELIVSPQGSIAYVPFAILTGKPASMTPSATTHVLLRGSDPRTGKGVLALGDPEYGVATRGENTGAFARHQRLSQLPATRAEVASVGDVVLLGAEANETQLRKRLTERTRWRAVHLACHGLVEPDRPLMSSLALSTSPESDGFLTVLEVLRSDIPADLAVLSACETARGKIQQGEGIVGLARAFMYAGTPRVLCSLWKVDDEATSALMQAFYENWNPKSGSGLGASAALRKAQNHVRSQKKWAHPYYWAAWVLWGLPTE